MKKSFKRVFSILLGMLVLCTIVPGAYAQVNVSKLPTGNSEGRLIEEGMSVRIGNYETLDSENTETFTDGAVLADGFFFSAADVLTYENAADITGESDSITLTTPDSNQTETGTRTLDGTNNTIEFEWGTEKTVKRFEIWVWPVGAIKDYEIQYHDGTNWEICSAGTFDQTQPVPAEDAKNYAGKRTVSYITTFDPVSTKKLRFVAKTFKEGYSSAKIAEAIPRSSNNVSLLATYSMTKGASNGGWLEGTNGKPNSGYNSRASQYALNFSCSQADFSQWSTYCFNNGDLTCALPVQKNYSYSPCNITVTTNAAKSDALWYAVRLTDSPQKINKAAFTVKSGAVRKFEIWCNAADNVTLSPQKAAPSGGTWQKMATVEGDFGLNEKAVAYISNTVAAEYWMIKVTDYDEGTKFALPELYVLHQETTLFGDASFDGGNDAGILTDSFCYVAYDRVKMADPDVKRNLDKVAKFTAVNSGILYANEIPVEVKRLDLWILNNGGIKEYRVEKSDNKKDWTSVKAGEFKKYTSAPVDDTIYNEDGSVNKKATTQASYYPVIFDEPVKAAYIRFVIESFYDNEKGAYISEALLRDTNEINLAQQGVMKNVYNETNYWAYSPYIVGFNGTCDPTPYSSAEIWSHWSNGYKGYGMKKKSDNFYYATTFGASKVKVNRVGIELQAGIITQFEVWRGNSETGNVLYESTGIPSLDTYEKTKNQYKRIAVIDCNLTTESTELFDLPYAEEADAYMIKVTGCSDDAHIKGFKFYALSDSELTPYLSDAKLTGELKTGENVEFSVFYCNYKEPDAAVFFVLYSGDQIVNIAKEDCALTGVNTAAATYTVPAETGGNLSLRAYLWNKNSLNPILQSPAMLFSARE